MSPRAFFLPADSSDWQRAGLAALCYFLPAALVFFLGGLVSGPSPIWPSAGVALGFLLIYGPRLWIGVLAGAVAASWLGFALAGQGLSLTSFVVGSTASIGAVLQALFGRWVILRYNAYPSRLSDPGEIASFVALAGPVSCILNATLTGIAGTVVGAVGFGSILKAFSWYTADVVGCILVAPAMVILHNAERRRAVQVGVPILVSLVLVFAVYGVVRRLLMENSEAEFHRRAAPLARQIDRSLVETVQLVQSVHAFFLSSVEVSADEFRRFASDSIPDHLGVQALEWAVRTPHPRSGPPAVFDGVRRIPVTERGPGNVLVPAARRDEYFPVTFIEPEAENPQALGYDLASEKVRRAALEQAVRQGSVAVSGPLTLVQGGRGFLLAVPIFHGGGIPPDELSRWRALRGFVIGVFRTGHLIEHALRDLDKSGITVSLTDRTDSANPETLYNSPADRSISPAEQKGKAQAGGLRIVHAVHRTFAGRSWVISLSASPPFAWGEPGYLAWGVLAMGMLFAILLESLLLLMTGRAAAVESLVAVRSAELYRAVEALRITNEELSRSLEERSRFYAKITHELRTPLAGIKEGVGIVRDGLAGPLTDEQKELLSLAEQEVGRLHRFINEVLDFSRLMTDPMSVLRPVPTDLNELLVRMARSQQAVAVQKGLALQIDLDSTLPSVTCDGDRMAQVTLNLLSNALRLTEKGSVRISTRFHSDKGQAEITVSDTGPGILPENQERIFREFQQERPGPGTTGLGLAISRQIVERHGGRIWVESTPGAGASFHIMLPVVAAPMNGERV